ncbi:MAG: hypothetical protein ACRYG8_06435 [Janthinobacterium lividum]
MWVSSGIGEPGGGGGGLIHFISSSISSGTYYLMGGSGGAPSNSGTANASYPGGNGGAGGGAGGVGGYGYGTSLVNSAAAGSTGLELETTIVPSTLFPH